MFFFWMCSLHFLWMFFDNDYMFYECFLQTLMSVRQDSLDVLRDVRISTDRMCVHVLQTMYSQQINTNVYVSIPCIRINLCLYISLCNCLHKFTRYMLAFVCSIHYELQCFSWIVRNDVCMYGDCSARNSLWPHWICKAYCARARLSTMF